MSFEFFLFIVFVLFVCLFFFFAFFVLLHTILASTLWFSRASFFEFFPKYGYIRAFHGSPMSTCYPSSPRACILSAFVPQFCIGITPSDSCSTHASLLFFSSTRRVGLFHSIFDLDILTCYVFFGSCRITFCDFTRTWMLFVINGAFR